VCRFVWFAFIRPAGTFGIREKGRANEKAGDRSPAFSLQRPVGQW
jgi:hypothetical protein